MSKGVIIFVIGILLIIATSIAFMYYVEEMAKKTNTVTVKGEGYKNLTYNLSNHTGYMIVISTKDNISYQILDPHGAVIKNGTVRSENNIYINTTVQGKYILKFRNNGNTEGNVNILIVKTNDLNTFATKELALMGMCVVGVIVVIIGVVMSFHNRRRNRQ